MSRQENDDISSENPPSETRRNEARESETRRRTGESEKQRSSRPTSLRRERETRKRGGGEDNRDWDSDSPPKEEHFETEEGYQKAYRQWKRHVERKVGLEVEEWPRLVNVSTTAEMYEEACGISRSTFYRRHRWTLDFDAQPINGKVIARRDKVISNILITETVNRKK